MNRLSAVFRRYGWRSPIVVAAIAAARMHRASSVLRTAWLRAVTLGTKGRRIRFGRGVTITPGGHLTLGDKVYLGDRVHVEIGVEPRAAVTIGSGTWISRDCQIVSCRSVSIGQHVLVGEFVSIRDSMHEYGDPGQPTKAQGDRIGTIVIGDDVWLGRGCLVQGRPEGVTIGRGAVVAANSVVTSSIPELEVWGGAPARFLKRRGE